MRKLRSKEKVLLKKLLTIAEIEEDISILKVQKLSDGEMGSIGIGANYNERNFGRVVAEYEFKDIDGVLAFASLNLDENENLYEIDVWKVDFSPTKYLKPN